MGKWAKRFQKNLFSESLYKIAKTSHTGQLFSNFCLYESIYVRENREENVVKFNEIGV